MKNILWTMIMLCIFRTASFAQTDAQPPVLPSEPIISYTLFVQPHLTCQCLPTNSTPKERAPIFFLDIPISPFWDTVGADRIKNRTIQFGGSATPWKETAVFGGWPVPRIIFAVSDFRASVEGGIMKTQNASLVRTMEQAYVTLDGAVWYVLVGAEGFFGQEQIPRATKSVNFEADFRRRSYGGQGWLGIKIGDFNRSFIVGRYGRGYARTEGSTRFNVPSVDDLDRFSLYAEEFKIESFSVEGKARAKRISQSVQFERVEYQRVIPSPDPLRFGENHLQDMRLETETEITPFPRARLLRGVVVLTKDFRNQNRLMFINDYSSVRVFLRLAF